MAGSPSRRIHACRVCGGDLVLVLDLGDLPLANGFRREVDPPTLLAPCRVMRCEGCGHVQLGDTINPDLVFRSYPFRAGASEGWKRHVKAFADTLGNPPGFAIDIGSNDGTMLAALAGRAWKVLGVDPSLENNAEHGYATMTGYWSVDLVERILARHGPADLLTAFNVLGHVDDPIAFLGACKKAMKPTGRLVVETPWVVPIFKHGTYDTFYHEHLSTWGLRPLTLAAKEAGLVVQDCGVAAVHGGSLRVTLGYDGGGRWDEVAIAEAHALRPMEIDAFRFRVSAAQEAVALWCEGERSAQNLVVGYGASARGNVLLNTIPDLGATLQSIVDDTPEKQGLLTPGYGVAVEKPGPWLRGVDSMIALSYPWGAQMLEKARGFGFKGPMYVPFHGVLT